VIGDLSILYAHDINRLKLNLAMGRSDSKIRALVGAMIRLVGRNAIAIRELPVDFRVEIAERFTKVRVELPNARLVGAGSRLCRVIHEIVSEDLLENVEVSSTLNFVSVAPNNRLGCL
jgi:hypothetical protein